MKQFIKFSIVGLSNTIISYLIYVASLKVFERLGICLSVDYLISSAIAFFLSIQWSFFLNNKYIFKKKSGEQRLVWKVLLKTNASYALTGLVLNNILLYLWVDIIGISKHIAPLINLVVTVPLNFVLNKYWAFQGEQSF